MPITVAIVRELMTAYGLTSDALIAALERIESAEICGSPADIRRVDVSAERRRERDRLRKSAERLRKSADDGGIARINKPLTTSKEVSKKDPPNPPSAEIRRHEADFFETSFWSIYPRKVGKGGARRAFKTACLKTSPETIVEAVRRFAVKCAGMEDKFIPHAATWLHDERWQDADLSPKPQEPEHPSGVYVQYGTPQGDAWEHLFRTVRKRVPPRDRNNGWWFPTEFPDRSAA